VSLLDIENMAIRPRVTITLDKEIYKELSLIADEQERTPANLAAYIVTKFIKDKLQSTQEKNLEASSIH
jgi:predicted transcriptional regulator